MASHRRRSFARRAAFVLVLGAAVQACSLVIPFGDYAGSIDAATDARSGEDANDGGAPREDAGDGEAGTPACDADTRTDPKNCGECGRVCAGDGECKAGRCPIEPVVVAPDGGVVAAIAIDELPGTNPPQKYLYFTTSNGTVHRMSLVAGATSIEEAPTTAALAATGPLSLRAGGGSGMIAIDGGVAWFKARAFTEKPRLLAIDRPNVGPVIFEGTRTFWGDSNGVSWRTASDVGPDAATVATDPTPPPVAFAGASPNRLLWTTADGVTYETSSASPGAHVVLLDGGAPGTTCLATSGTAILVGQKSQGVIVYDWDQAQITTTFRTKVTFDDPEALAADEKHMYVVTFRPGGKADLRRASLDGSGTPIVLAVGFDASRALALSDGFVYFADGDKIVRTSW